MGGVSALSLEGLSDVLGLSQHFLRERIRFGGIK